MNIRRSQLTSGLALWPAALLLSRWLLLHKDLFAGGLVLELGAGCALPSIVAGMCSMLVPAVPCLARVDV